MAVHRICIVGDPVLHNPTREVTEFDTELKTLVDDMFETMAAARGVGLAANQIGVDLRVFVYDCPDDDGVQHRGVICNPVLETSEIPETMPDPDDDFEGCLSVSDFAALTARHAGVRVTGLDERAEPVSIEARGWYARILQHETDHLNGSLYVDQMVTRSFMTEASFRRHWQDRSVAEVCTALGLTR